MKCQSPSRTALLTVKLPSEEVHPRDVVTVPLVRSVHRIARTNERQHKLFEQTLVKMRDVMQSSFNSFAADTQKAYQGLRQEITGEKRISLTLLNELIEVGFEMEQIVAARPPITPGDGTGEPIVRWADAIEVQCRKVGAALIRNGIHRYDAVISSPYNPALHERVGSKRVDGMDALRIAEQVQHGYASQQPQFVLTPAKGDCDGVNTVSDASQKRLAMDTS